MPAQRKAPWDPKNGSISASYVIDYANTLLWEEASSTVTGPAGPDKRREQVRHAQRWASPIHAGLMLSLPIAYQTLIYFPVAIRIHRERTQNYIKTLESEVIRLRGSEAHLMRENDRLQGEVDNLKSTLISYDIHYSPGSELSATTEDQTLLPNNSEMATVSYHRDEMSHQRLHVNLPQQLARDAPPSPVAYNFSPEAIPLATQQYQPDSEQQNTRNLPDGTLASSVFDSTSNN